MSIREVKSEGSIYDEPTRLRIIDRSRALVEEIRDLIDGKLVFEIGCSEGHLLYEFSKYANKVVSVETNEQTVDIAKQKQYECDAIVEHGEAFQYLAENQDLIPDVFYYRTNFDVMEQFLQKILELRGKTKPTIVFGASTNALDGNPQQLIEAKKIQEKYGGRLIHIDYHSVTDIVIGKAPERLTRGTIDLKLVVVPPCGKKV